MKILLFLLLFLPLATHAESRKKIYNQWKGASEAEFTAKWGYPETQYDIVMINDEVKVYTYRSSLRTSRGPRRCTISFTIKKGIVSFWKARGYYCPRIKRYNKKKKND